MHRRTLKAASLAGASLTAAGFALGAPAARADARHRGRAVMAGPVELSEGEDPSLLTGEIAA